jgi:hypothetical protein
MNIEVLWVTFLDPRSRKMKHLSSKTEYESAKRMFVQEVKDVAWNTMALTETTTTTTYDNEVEVGNDPFLMGMNTFDSPTKQVNPEENDDNGLVFESFAAAVQREIENYLDPHIHVPPSTDPLHWWRENRFRFPKTAIAARKWLCVPGTSTPSERIFSHCGIALSAKRSSMRGDALMNQILLKNNLSHILCTVVDVKNALLKLE